MESLRSTFLPVLPGRVKNNKMTIIKIKRIIADMLTPVIPDREFVFKNTEIIFFSIAFSAVRCGSSNNFMVTQNRVPGSL